MKTTYKYMVSVVAISTVTMCSSGDNNADGDEEYEGDNIGECKDGADNDRDGLFDCDDEGCAGVSYCLNAGTDRRGDSVSDLEGDGETSAIDDSDLDTGIVDDFDTDNICDSIELTAGAVPNRVLIIQDLSSSLKDFGRWDEIKVSMVQVIEAFDNEIALGVVPFATTILDGVFSDSDCTVNSKHVVSPKPGNADAIYNLVYTIETDDLIGGTPTNDALLTGRDVLVNEDPKDGSSRHMILVTDGLPNCLDGNGSGSGEQADVDRVTDTIQKIYEEDNIEVFVVGYSIGSSSMGNLDTWAERGGTQHAYPANDAASLLEQMSAISVGLVTCSYKLDSQVADPRYVRVQIDGTTLPYDETKGWSLSDDKETVTFEGASCDLLQDGETHDIQVAVECNIVII